MSSESDLLDKLAQSIADGASIDWEEIDDLPADAEAAPPGQAPARRLECRRGPPLGGPGRRPPTRPDHHQTDHRSPAGRPGPFRSGRRSWPVGAPSSAAQNRRRCIRPGLPRARYVARSSCRAQALQSPSHRSRSVKPHSARSQKAGPHQAPERCERSRRRQPQRTDRVLDGFSSMGPRWPTWSSPGASVQARRPTSARRSAARSPPCTRPRSFTAM